jgi:hypothetical protein
MPNNIDGLCAERDWLKKISLVSPEGGVARGDNGLSARMMARSLNLRRCATAVLLNAAVTLAAAVHRN